MKTKLLETIKKLMKIEDICSDVQFWVLAFSLAGFWGFASLGPGWQVLVLPKAPSISIHLYHHKLGGRMALTSSESEGEVAVFSTESMTPCWYSQVMRCTWYQAHST